MEKSKIIIYKTSKNEVELKVLFERESVWLTQNQIAMLFGTQRPAVTKHLNNIFKTGELTKKSVSSILEHTASDGKIYKTQFYNLDAIISVGYRVNSALATQFRIWATKIIKQYLLQGYSVNEARLLEAKERFLELQNAISFIQEKAKKKILAGKETEILDLLSSYAKALTLLEEYDRGYIKEKSGKKAKFILTYEDCINVLARLKTELILKKEASDLFGQERERSFEGIIKGLYQTFDKKELYHTLEDKAAHLLYLTIKDHPFSDGNKRSASFLFVYYLKKADSLYRKNGEGKINDNALAVLALMIAESDPKEKDIMIKIIKKLIVD